MRTRRGFNELNGWHSLFLSSYSFPIVQRGLMAMPFDGPELRRAVHQTFNIYGNKSSFSPETKWEYFYFINKNEIYCVILFAFTYLLQFGLVRGTDMWAGQWHGERNWTDLDLHRCVSEAIYMNRERKGRENCAAEDDTQSKCVPNQDGLTFPLHREWASRGLLWMNAEWPIEWRPETNKISFLT